MTKLRYFQIAVEPSLPAATTILYIEGNDKSNCGKAKSAFEGKAPHLRGAYKLYFKAAIRLLRVSAAGCPDNKLGKTAL
jgi:hypothetical protein